MVMDAVALVVLSQVGFVLKLLLALRPSVLVRATVITSDFQLLVEILFLFPILSHPPLGLFGKLGRRCFHIQFAKFLSDDGNKIDGDGCSSTCQLEFGYSCGTPGTPCFSMCSVYHIF